MTRPTVDRETITTFAPVVYLHPYDNHRPASVHDYLRTVYLLDEAGTVLAETVTPEVLERHNLFTNYLRFADDRFPTGEDDFHTGAWTEADPRVAGQGRCRAPVYVKTFTYDTHLDLKYAYFYPFNGFQTFRVGIRDGFSTKKRNFLWARYARHEGDWEHVTVRLTPDGRRLIGVFYARHGDSVFVEDPNLVEDTHPVVFSALSSHASYDRAVTTAVDNVLSEPGLLPIGWLKAVDTTSTDELDALRYYARPEPFFSQVEWRPWGEPDLLVPVDEDATAARWLAFKGRWGPPRLDNTHIDRPPSMPAKAQDRLFDDAKFGKLLGLPSDTYLYGEGPTSPEQQRWWNDKEQ
jgi:hypothetical protein